MIVPPDKISADVKAWYDENEGPGSFENMVFRCLSRGVLIKSKHWFLAAERVGTDGETIEWDSETPNCWFVHFSSGEGHKRIEYSRLRDEKLPYLAWQRRGKGIKIHRAKED